MLSCTILRCSFFFGAGVVVPSVAIGVGGKACGWIEVVGLDEGVSEVRLDWGNVALFDIVGAEGSGFDGGIVMRFEGAAWFEWCVEVRGWG
jgi:hypothetical protein